MSSLPAGYRRNRGFIAGNCKKFVFFPKQYERHCGLPSFLSGLRWPEPEAGHPPASHAEIKNQWATLPLSILFRGLYKKNSFSFINFSSIRLSIQQLFLISGFRRELVKNCFLVSCNAASSGNYLPTFRDKVSVTFSKGYRSQLQGSRIPWRWDW